ncbi:MAG: hypothetical protein JSS28_06440 [Proteobacteria bacterium]|nr:hypothetical protein [Pseudomonadota bacterium]
MRRFFGPSCLLSILAAAGFAQSVAADTEHTTPSVSEMSPAEWRRLQLKAADQSDKIMRDARKQPGLLAQYLYMQAHYDADHDRAFQLIFGQYLSWFQTFIGDYDGAAASFSIAQPNQPDDARTPLSENWQAKPAADVILGLAKTRKAVFFNEAHSAPVTRTLTIELLAKLRAEGFNYFAAETLYRNDKELNRRGYPTPDSGFYIDEPLLGEMVRTALKLGYKVVAYDVENAGAGDARELAGAQNLYHIFKQDANARLVVDAGFAHIQKSGKYLGGSSMAEFFQKMSGIDPLCVEQTMMIQHARPDQDHPYYTAIIDAVHPAQAIVFVDGSKTWTLKPKEYDLSVVLPSAPQTDLRPDWLALDGLRVPYPVGGEICRGHSPCLVQANYANEGDDAVAADRALINVVDPKASLANQVFFDHGSARSRLFLRPGRYRVTATDRSNHVVTTRDVTIPALGKDGNP